MKVNKIKKKILNKYSIRSKKKSCERSLLFMKLLTYNMLLLVEDVYILNKVPLKDPVYGLISPLHFSKNFLKGGNHYKGLVHFYKFIKVFKKIYKIHGLFTFYTMFFNFLVIVQLRKIIKYNIEYKATDFLSYPELYIFRTLKFFNKVFGKRWLIGNSLTYDLFNQNVCLIFALKNSRVKKVSTEFSQEIYYGRKFTHFKW